MGYRAKPIDSEEAAANDLYDRIRGIEEALRDRLIPPGYVINESAAGLVITRKADGATSTLSFT